MCSLEPGKTWKDWFDPYGNKLRILKNSVKVTESKINSEGIHDIYCKSTFGPISRHSYWCGFIIGNNEDLFWFIGTDGILRHLVRSKGAWRSCPPMLSGYKIVSKIANLCSIDQPEMISFEGDGESSSHKTTMYITPWPPEKEIQEVLEENNIV